MLNRRLILSILLTGILFLNTVAFAETFSLYGNIHELDGAPIQGVIVKLVDLNNLVLNITVTDSNGTYSFNDIACSTGQCSVRMTYPDDNSYINPGNYYALFPASGVRTINTTRIKAYDHRPSVTPEKQGVDFNLVLLFFIGVTVLGCVYMIFKVAKNWRY